MPNERFEFVFDVNVVVPAMLMNTFLEVYQEQQAQKVIVNISSGVAFKGNPYMAHYVASKGAVVSLVKSLSRTERPAITAPIGRAPGPAAR